MSRPSSRHARLAAILDPDVTFHDPLKKGKCESGKDRFRNEYDAGMALVNCKIARILHRKSKRKEQRYYACALCCGWHLTSRPVHVKAAGESR